MPRTKSVILTPAQKKEALIEAKAALKAAKEGKKALILERKAHEKAGKELGKREAAAQKEIDTIAGKIESLAA